MNENSSFAGPLSAAMHHALAHIDGLRERSVDATVTLDELRRRIDFPLAQHGEDPEQVIHQLVRACDGGIVGSAGPRFFGFVIGGAVPAALAADWLTSTWDQNAGLYACGPSAAVVEEVVGTWAAELLGLPPSASFALVTGCQMAHVTALAAARHAVLARVGWDVNERGLTGAPTVNVVVGAERHATIDRALRLLGFGTAGIIAIPADGQG